MAALESTTKTVRLAVPGLIERPAVARNEIAAAVAAIGYPADPQ